MANIKHVQGNVLRIAIPLDINTVTENNGSVVQTTEAFYPNTDYPVRVVLKKGGTKYSYEASLSGNVASIEDPGTLPVGAYNVEVLCRDSNANPMRYMVRSIIEIVDATIDAGIEAGVEFDSEQYTLDGAVFIAFVSEGGVATETDPIFSASPAATITEAMIALWNQGGGSGGYVVTFDDGNVIFEASGSQPTFDNGNVIL